MATMSTALGASQSAALWIDMPAPGTTKSGFRLSWTREKTGSNYRIELWEVTGGTEASLGWTVEPLSAGASLALVDEGSEVSIWLGSGGTLTELGSSTGTACSEGSDGIEATGATGRITNFRAGHLVSRPIVGSAVPASPGGTARPDIAGTAEAGMTVSLFTNEKCTGGAVATGTATRFAEPGLRVTVEAGKEHTYWAQASDGSGDVSSFSTTSKTYKNTGSGLIFEGTKTSDFPEIYECLPSRISEVTNPLGVGIRCCRSSRTQVMSSATENAPGPRRPAIRAPSSAPLRSSKTETNSGSTRG